MLRTWCAFAGLCAGGALSGTTSSLRSSCRLRRGEPTSENNITFSPALSFGCGSSPESATKEKEMHKHFFRDYFAPSGLVPLLRNGANRHPRITFRSPLLCRSDVVLVRSKYKEKRDAKMHLFFLGALSGTRTLGPLIKSQLLYQLS